MEMELSIVKTANADALNQTPKTSKAGVDFAERSIPTAMATLSEGTNKQDLYIFDSFQKMKDPFKVKIPSKFLNNE
jgi:hypothetical protein